MGWWLLILFVVGVATYVRVTRYPQPPTLRLERRRRRRSLAEEPQPAPQPPGRPPSTRQVARWMRNLDRLANRLDGGQVVHTYGRQRVEGSMAGREVRVELRFDSDGAAPAEVVFEVEADPELRLHCRANPDDPLGYDLAEGPMLAPAAAQLLQELFRSLGFRHVVASPGLVRGFRRASNRSLGRQRLNRSLAVLTTLAEQLEGQANRSRPLKIRVLRGAEIGSLRIEAGDDTSERICPYCKDVLGGADVVGCEECDTLHHAECLTELGRCATLACPGKTGVAVTRA